MDLVPIHVKVVFDKEWNQRLVINGYRLHNLVDPYTQEDLDKDIDNFQTNEEAINESNEKVINEFYADELIIRSSLDHDAEYINEQINGLANLEFEAHINLFTYRNSILHGIPWFPSFSVGALSFDEPILAARCVPRILYQTQALKPFKNFYYWSPTSETPTEFETTREWICAEPNDYVSFHLADFINGMQNIMGKTYKEFLEQDVY